MFKTIEYAVIFVAACAGIRILLELLKCGFGFAVWRNIKKSKD